MPRANAKNYTINIAPNANFFALPEFVISHTSKIPAAIAKNFIHYIHSFLLDYSITHKARFVNSFFEIYNILWEIKSEYIIYFLCCKNLVYYILFQIWLVNWCYEPPKVKESLQFYFLIFIEYLLNFVIAETVSHHHRIPRNSVYTYRSINSIARRFQIVIVVHPEKAVTRAKIAAKSHA